MDRMPPALIFAQKLCGGTWKLVQSRIEAEFQFLSQLEGAVVEGRGNVKVNEKTVRVLSRFGWDPVAKKVFYLDMQNHDGVYFGHVTVDEGVWINRFRTLVGPPAEYQQEATLPGSHLLDSHLYSIGQDGSKTLVEHMIFHRHMD